MINPKEKKSVESPGAKGARRATGGPGEQKSHPDPEVKPSTRTRRRLTVGYKLKVLAAVEELRLQGDGAIGAYLRKEGLYYATVHKWAKLQEKGLLTSNKPGPQQKSHKALQSEITKLRRKLEQTEKKLKKTELIVDLQKKLSSFLAIDHPEHSDKSDGS